MRFPEPTHKEIEVHSPAAMRAVGGVLASAVAAAHGAPLVVGFEGELGAGKTTLVAGVLAHFGEHGPVRSPTYTLVEPYEAGGRTIYHLDLYRLTDPGQLEPLGVRDMLIGDAVLLIEWPSRAGKALPPTDLDVGIQYVGKAGRRLALTAHTDFGDKLLRAIVAAQPE